MGRVGRGTKAGGHEVGTEEEVRTWGHLPDPDSGLPPAVQPGHNHRDPGMSKSRDCHAAVRAGDPPVPHVYEPTCSLPCDLLKGKAQLLSCGAPRLCSSGLAPKCPQPFDE